jgi:hypothetical protein
MRTLVRSACIDNDLQLLDPSGETAWIRHAAGAARLIQLRGPDNYSTDFEKALFMAHTGPIVCSPSQLPTSRDSKLTSALEDDRSSHNQPTLLPRTTPMEMRPKLCNNSLRAPHIRPQFDRCRAHASQMPHPGALRGRHKHDMPSE